MKYNEVVKFSSFLKKTIDELDSYLDGDDVHELLDSISLEMEANRICSDLMYLYNQVSAAVKKFDETIKESYESSTI